MRSRTRRLALRALIGIAVVAGVVVAGRATTGAASPSKLGVHIGHGPVVHAGVMSTSLRSLPVAKPKKRPEYDEELQNPAHPGKFTATAPAAPATSVAAPAPSPSTSFDGLGFASWGAGYPPDTVGDVGPSHFVQAVNTSFGVFSKTGVQLVASTLDALWAGAGTGTSCDTVHSGDPTVVYDPLGDRWIVADFSLPSYPSPPFYECIAVSRTSNPVTGGWYMYAVRTDDAAHPWFADYPKMGIWPDALYMTANMFDSSGFYREPRVWAFRRSDLESGLPLHSVVADLGSSTYFSLLPANLRGEAPPAGRDELLVSESLSLYAFSVWKLHADFTGSGSTLTGPTNVSQTSYNNPPSTIPSPANTLDSLGDRLMMQAQYRNFGGVESLWVNHTVRTSASGPAGIQWAQLNVTGGTVAATPVQQQIFGNLGSDGLHRWMGSLAVDRNGDMALGYSVASSTVYPGLRYSGRLASDAAGTLPQGEGTLISGAGSESGLCGGATCHRFGDYSAMSIDPDGCTFWFTSEYFADVSLSWRTRIGSFRFPGCAVAPTVTGFAPASGGVGDSIVLSGSGFTGATAVAFNGTSAAFSVDSDTRITTTVPAGASSGPISVTTGGGTASSTTSFAVAARTLAAAPTTGTPGERVVLTGHGFHPGTAVTLKWDCASAGCASTKVLSTVTASSAGAFSRAVAIPAGLAAGSHSIGALDASGGFAATSFTVVLPTLAATPVTGTVGAAFSVSGTNFHAGSTVTLKWSCATSSCTSTTVLATPTVAGDGTFTAPVTVPAGSTARPVSIGGKDAAGAFAKVTFRVAPKLAIAPSRGAAGSTPTVTGDAYKPGEPVTLLWDCATTTCSSTTVLATPVADGAGHFSVPVTIPGAGFTVGTVYRLRGRGGTSGGVAYAAFRAAS